MKKIYLIFALATMLTACGAKSNGIVGDYSFELTEEMDDETVTAVGIFSFNEDKTMTKSATIKILTYLNDNEVTLIGSISQTGSWELVEGNSIAFKCFDEKTEITDYQLKHEDEQTKEIVEGMIALSQLGSGFEELNRILDSTSYQNITFQIISSDDKGMVIEETPGNKRYALVRK